MRGYLLAVLVIVAGLVGCEETKKKSPEVSVKGNHFSTTKTSLYGGCDFFLNGYCIDYVGADFKDGYRSGNTQKNCVSSGLSKQDVVSSEGKYATNGCASTDQLDTCTLDGSLGSEVVVHAYNNSGLAADDWKQICLEMKSAR